MKVLFTLYPTIGSAKVITPFWFKKIKDDGYEVLSLIKGLVAITIVAFRAASALRVPSISFSIYIHFIGT